MKAVEYGYEICQPNDLNSNEIIGYLNSFKPDFFVVVAFGHILKETILNIPKIAPINIHASILPKYRGPAPIHWAIVNGETQTGITTMLMDKGMDTGDVLMVSKTDIFFDDTAEKLHDRLAHMGGLLIVKTLDAYLAKTITPIKQDHAKAIYAPMLKKKDGLIDWSLPAENVDSLIRGMTPWPGAYTFYGKKRFKIFRATPVSGDAKAPPGTVLESEDDRLLVATGKGMVTIEELQGASGKRLFIKNFLMGHPIPSGTRFK